MCSWASRPDVGGYCVCSVLQCVQCAAVCAVCCSAGFKGAVVKSALYCSSDFYKVQSAIVQCDLYCNQELYYLSTILFVEQLSCIVTKFL